MNPETEQQIVGYGNRVLIQMSSSGVQLELAVKGVLCEIRSLDRNQDRRATAGGGHGDRFRYSGRFNAFRLKLREEFQLCRRRLDRHSDRDVRRHQRPGFAQ